MIPNPLRWLGVALVLALAIDHARVRVTAANLRTEHAEYVAEAEAAARKASDDARAVEQMHAREVAEIVAAHRKEDARAKHHAESVIAGVRSGAERLRKSLTCPARGVPGASSAPGGSDAAKARGFTPEDAAAAFGIAADGDAAVRKLGACQAVIEAQRRAVNGAPK